MSETDARTRVRQLLLSGDNMLKNRSGDERYARARERYEQARAVAVDAGLPDDVVALIDRRIGDLEAA